MNPDYTFAPDEFITGDYPMKTEPETILSGQNLPARSVLGRVTASGKWVLSLSAAVDGSEVPRAILAEAIDASAGDVDGPVFKSGTYNPTLLNYGAGHDADTVKAAFEGTPLFLHEPK